MGSAAAALSLKQASRDGAAKSHTDFDKKNQNFFFS